MAKGLSLNRSRQAPAEDTPAFGGIAERFRRAGDLDRAITLCRDGLKKFPAQLSAHVTLGWALLDKGQYAEARVELEHVRRRAPDNLAAIRGLAELHDREEHAVVSLGSHSGWHEPEEAAHQVTSAPAARPLPPPTADVPPAPRVAEMPMVARVADVAPAVHIVEAMPAVPAVSMPSFTAVESEHELPIVPETFEDFVEIGPAPVESATLITLDASDAFTTEPSDFAGHDATGDEASSALHAVSFEIAEEPQAIAPFEVVPPPAEAIAESHPPYAESHARSAINLEHVRPQLVDEFEGILTLPEGGSAGLNDLVEEFEEFSPLSLVATQDVTLELPMDGAGLEGALADLNAPGGLHVDFDPVMEASPESLSEMPAFSSVSFTEPMSLLSSEPAPEPAPEPVSAHVLQMAAEVAAAQAKRMALEMWLRKIQARRRQLSSGSVAS